MSTSRKIPRKTKQWVQDVFDALIEAQQLKTERFYGVYVDENEPSPLAKDRDAFTALGVLYAFMHRGITEKKPMLDALKEAYKQIIEELKRDLISHPGEMFVSAYLFSNVHLGLLSYKKYDDIHILFKATYGEQLGWNSDDYEGERYPQDTDTDKT
ncbi:MAG: hypothetical protein U5M23_10515 [Marinagarivorans sp.]|nr:hypothetical protein [Marinagarivorans sp.]